MTTRRRSPESTIPMGGADSRLSPPTPVEEFAPQILASTDPEEGPLISPLAKIPPTGVEGEDHRLVGEPVTEEEEEEQELSPEEQVMFASLLTCGRRSKVVHILDHTVVVQTLCGDDDLRIALYVKDYVGTVAEQRAYQIGVAAAGIRSIDGKPLESSLFEGADESALFDAKASKVGTMYPHVINKIYRAVMDAEKEFVELATKLGKLDG